MQGTTTTYQQEAVRRGGVTAQMASCRRNPLPCNWLGRSTSACCVAHRRRTSSHQYAFLLAPCGPRASTQRRLREVMKGALR